MTAAEILAIITGVSQALPALVGVYKDVTEGKTVSKEDVQAILSQYQLNHDTFAADLAAGK
jgi:hypothetical protein